MPFSRAAIGFLDIAATVERTLERIPPANLDSLDDVYNLDSTAREVAAELIAGCAPIARRRLTDIG